MAVLKKIKSFSIMETLVATVLIIVIFMIASLVLNNLFSNTINGNTSGVKNHLLELEYLYLNDKITLPYSDDFNKWEVLVEKSTQQQHTINFTAIHLDSKKAILKTLNAKK